MTNGSSCEISCKGGGQLWELFLTRISSFSPSPLFILHLHLLPYPVIYGESFITLKCTNLATWFWVGCLKSTTALFFLSGHLPHNHNSPVAKGKT